MKAIVINPWFRSIGYAEHDGSLENLYWLMTCPIADVVDIVEVALMFRNGDALYVDEEALFKNDRHSFIIADRRLIGMGVILGTDHDGDCKTMLTDLEVSFI